MLSQPCPPYLDNVHYTETQAIDDLMLCAGGAALPASPPIPINDRAGRGSRLRGQKGTCGEDGFLGILNYFVGLATFGINLSMHQERRLTYQVLPH